MLSPATGGFHFGSDRPSSLEKSSCQGSIDCPLASRTLAPLWDTTIFRHVLHQAPATWAIETLHKIHVFEVHAAYREAPLFLPHLKQVGSHTKTPAPMPMQFHVPDA